MRNKITRVEWEQLISEYEQSNEERYAFCQKRGIPKTRFDYWFSRLNSNSKSKRNSNKASIYNDNFQNNGPDIIAPGWVEVKVKDSGCESQSEKVSGKSNFLVIKVGKAEINVTSGYDKLLLADVVKVLGELC